MREIIGKTRFGNDVWIEGTVRDGGQLNLIVAKFELPSEQYDAFCLLDAYRARLDRVDKELSGTGHVYRHLTEQIDNWLRQNAGQMGGPEARALGHRVSTDRLRYAKGLLHPAYRG